MSTQASLIGLSVVLLGAGPVAAQQASDIAVPRQESTSTTVAPDVATPRNGVPIPQDTAGTQRSKSTEATTTESLPRSAENSDRVDAMPAPASADGGFITQQDETQVTSDDLLGVKVVGPDGIDIGGIDSLLVNPDGAIVAAVVGVGGFLGIGDKPVALPWKDLAIVTGNRGERTIIASVTRDQLQQAPKFRTLSEQRVVERRVESRERTRSETLEEQATPPVLPGDKTKSPVGG